MKVIKGNTKDVELMALGENRWYQSGTEKDMLTENELTLREVMCSLTEEENEVLTDPHGAGHPSSYKTFLEERYNFYRRENSPLFDRELRSIEDIEKINQFPRFGVTDLANLIMELRLYSPRKGLKLDEKYLRQKVVDVEGYMVPITVAPILKALVHKYDQLNLFGGGHTRLTNAMKSVIATLYCVVIDKMCKTKIEDVTKDDVKDWLFCRNAIQQIVNPGKYQPDYFLEEVIVPVFLGFEAIRYEKDICEKLSRRITNLEVELERCKEARKMFKTQTSERRDEMKEYMVREALKWKGKNVDEITGPGIKFEEALP
ncbi:hypothetical protein TorRG33x02_061870 [Trema orientale]|uniref:Uncharacterized protein n=1 Tax=Trema orientale TaxID=63057 RepID=A0A2P5FK08_TREOI|nr:hypothetical protein TorRG33x02_061870 [Trema orientale]